jgi:SAM-dependent methyltransferase
MSRAMSRYDAIAEWYDEVSTPWAEAEPDGSALWLTRLLGYGQGWCLDLACGAGRHAAAIEATGRTVVGLELSAEQLRMARRRRLRHLVQADVARLPIGDSAVDAAVVAYLHTDIDDMAPVFAEVGRVLRPGGRLVFLGVHPCFVGHFVERRAAGAEVVLHAGYRDAGWHRDSPYFSPAGLGRRVGWRHVPLAELVNALLAAGLRLERVEEFGGDLDHGHVPRNLALVAAKPPA